MKLMNIQTNLFVCTDINILEIVSKDEQTDHIIEEFEFKKEFDIIISTIPGTSKLLLPDAIFKNNPIVMDISYIPKETNLIKQVLNPKS